MFLLVLSVYLFVSKMKVMNLSKFLQHPGIPTGSRGFFFCENTHKW